MKHKAKPSGKKEREKPSLTSNLLPYLTAASFIKLVLECVELLMSLWRSR